MCTSLMADHRVAQHRRRQASLAALDLHSPPERKFKAYGAGIALALAILPALGQGNLIYQEGFNDDGSVANPPRYTFNGEDVYEIPRIQSEIGNYDQKGPIYWNHNFKVSYTGNPAIPARRMIWTWRGVDTSTATEDLLKLFDSSVDWLLNGKKNATIVINPNAASMQGLADRLTAAGHTVLDDDTTATPDEQDVVGDLMIHGPGANNASRFVLVKKPVIVLNAPDYDDTLVGSIGTAATFAPGKVTITGTGHPAVGGKTGSFDSVTGDQPFELVGRFLPTGASTLATITHVVPPSVTSLADVDAMIAGTKAHDSTTGQVPSLDFSDASTANWSLDNAVPGGYAGNWGLQVKGKISVAAAGTYRFALGSDDGARLQIDLDKNGMTSADLIVEDPGPHAHQTVYANVTFSSAGTYDIQVTSYNSGGGGDLEVSVATQAVPVPDDALDSGYWEPLDSAGGTSPVKLQGSADVTAYIATGPDEQRQEPLIIVLNGPTDTPPGSFYDGGPMSGFEGTGFIGGAGLNKWPYPDTGYRSVRLKPVSVAGKTNVKLTIALAATVVDFETSDTLDVVVYPTGESSTPVTLAHFHGVQDAVQPWMADEKENYVRRLTRQFADFTYDVPAGATDLIVEIRAQTTWWTEIVAFDNIRITEGTGGGGAVTITSAKVSGTDLVIDWTGGNGPFLVQGRLDLSAGGWSDLYTTTARTAKIPIIGGPGYFRVQDGTTKTVKLYKASLNGANERPTPVDTTAVGAGLLAVDGTSATYYVSYAGLKQTATMAHVHGPADANTAAGVILPLTPATPLATSGIFLGQGTFTAQQVSDIAAGMTYFNVHSGAFPGGEIRGQLLPAN